MRGPIRASRNARSVAFALLPRGARLVVVQLSRLVDRIDTLPRFIERGAGGVIAESTALEKPAQLPVELVSFQTAEARRAADRRVHGGRPVIETRGRGDRDRLAHPQTAELHPDEPPGMVPGGPGYHEVLRERLIVDEARFEEPGHGGADRLRSVPSLRKPPFQVSLVPWIPSQHPDGGIPRTGTFVFLEQRLEAYIVEITAGAEGFDGGNGKAEHRGDSAFEPEQGCSFPGPRLNADEKSAGGRRWWR